MQIAINPSTLKRKIAEYSAELIGAFFLGVIIILSNAFVGGTSIFVIGLGFIFLYYTLRKYTKAHFYPTITLGNFIFQIFEYIRGITNKTADRKDILKPMINTIVYLMVQLIGILFAVLMVQAIREEVVVYQYNQNKDIEGTTIESVREQVAAQIKISNSYIESLYSVVFLIEFITTAALVYVFLAAVNDEKTKQNAGFIIGLAILVLSALALPLSGASFNPFRSWIPVLIEGGKALDSVGLYILAPVLGSLVGPVIYFTLEWLKNPQKTIKGSAKYSSKSKNTRR